MLNIQSPTEALLFDLALAGQPPEGEPKTLEEDIKRKRRDWDWDRVRI